MRRLFASLLVIGLICGVAVSSEKKISRIGVTMGSLANPGFVIMVEGVTESAKAHNTNCDVVAVSADYDLSKQSQQIDDFIAAGMDTIILNAVDVEGIAPAVRRAKEAGILVVALDVGAEGGVDGTITSNNVEAGRLAAQYLVEKLNGKGNVIIMNGAPVTAVIDRANGAREVFAKSPNIKLLSDNQNGVGNRDESYRIMGDLLTAYPEVNAVFAINDPSALGCELAIKQAGRKDVIVAGVDGAPDAIEAIQDKDNLFVASAAQQIRNLGYISMEVAIGLNEGKKLKSEPTLVPVKLLTADNVDSWPVWGPVGYEALGIQLWK